jgi:hypothetical protein
MAETSWTEEQGSAPKKRMIPTWAWFCGAGCLIALILGIAGSVFLVRGVKSAIDPERQWANLAEVLPHEERPRDWKLNFGMPGWIGVEVFMLQNEATGMVAVVMRLPESESEKARQQMLDATYSGSLFGRGGRKEMQASKIEIQGRELQALRFYQNAGRGGEGAAGSQQGASIFVDLTPPGETRALMLQLIRAGRGEPITDEEVQDFLAPFDVGSR